MLAATLRFDSTREADTADGWLVGLGDEADVQVITYHATITAAQAAILVAFQADPDVDGHFQAAAEGTVLTSEAATVASTKAALLTAEGL